VLPDLRPAAVAVGGFDGVHLGHQQILARARDAAHRINGSFEVLTLNPLPAQVIHPDFTYVLTPLAEKARLLKTLGTDTVHVLEFSTEVRKLSPARFAQRHIAERLRPAVVVVGHDHRFGADGRGDAAQLGSLLGSYGIEVEVVPEFEFQGGPVRSTRIREHLLLGAVRTAAELLGRPYSIGGSVVPGTGTGRKLGFPTLNIRPAERETLVPADGVYVCTIETLGSTYGGVLNIGHRPTFGGETRTIEGHVLDATLSEPPGQATFRFIDRLRPERRFESAAALAAQIAIDVTSARERLRTLKP
jgi:riboflavin kinase/FMN adenylyltransferase